MSAWEYILNTAMLGTDKKGPGKPDFPSDLAEVVELIENEPGADKEIIFLNTAAIAFNYRRCGFVPPKKPKIAASSALPETRPLCSDKASAVLSAILEENNSVLLETWLDKCDRNGQLVLPEILPALLEKGVQNPWLQKAVVNCSGNRGRWISQYNTPWNYFNPLSDEEIWQTGKLLDQVKVLKNLRQTEPEKGREWLQQIWEKENGLVKSALLKCFSVNSSPVDLPWLESLLAEKLQIVKDEVLALLKEIPGSAIIKQYEDLLKQSVVLKKEKALLGMINKTLIQLKLPATIDENIFKSGIEKLAGPKSSFSDEHYILYQLICFVPPPFWETQFNAAPGEVVAYFEKHAPLLLPALAQAVSRFNQRAWVSYFLHQDCFYVDFIQMLPAAESEKYLLKFIHKEGKNIINHALTTNFEWGTELALTALRLMADHPYEYTSAFFSKHIKLIPVSMVAHLEKIQPKEANLEAAWGKSKLQLHKLLDLKQRIQQAFNT